MVLRLTDAFLAFPAIAGVLLLRQVMFPANFTDPLTTFQKVIHSLTPVMIVLILFSWMPYARIINANILKLKQAEYTLAARTLGATHSRIIFYHLLPNAVAPVVVLIARDIGYFVILEASFRFIGLGGSLPWGILLVAGRDWIIGPGGNPSTYWWVFFPPTLVLILFAFAWNLLGDGLNTLMNPKEGVGSQL